MEDEIRVLVVEDDENVRIGVEQAVALAGFPVDAFASAADALAHVAPGAPVVIVSDVRMPGIDGLQLLARVMAVDAQIPVVLISGHDVAAPKPAPDPYLEACRRLGVEPGPEVIALEDSPTGVAAARAAGLTVIGVPSVDGVELAEAHHIAANLLDDIVTGLTLIP